MPQEFRSLKAWQKAHALVLLVHSHTAEFPREERFGLAQHLRKTATSIPCNIVEGAARGSARQFAHFLNLAFASASELEYQILLAHELGYLSAPAAEGLSALTVESRRLIHGLRHSVLK